MTKEQVAETDKEKEAYINKRLQGNTGQPILLAQYHYCQNKREGCLPEPGEGLIYVREELDLGILTEETLQQQDERLIIPCKTHASYKQKGIWTGYRNKPREPWGKRQGAIILPYTGTLLKQETTTRPRVEGSAVEHMEGYPDEIELFIGKEIETFFNMNGPRWARGTYEGSPDTSYTEALRLLEH